MTKATSKLEPGHWITLGGLAVQAVAIMAVVVWRVGAVERRLDSLDARLWELARARSASTITTYSPCPPDVTAVRLTSMEASP